MLHLSCEFYSKIQNSEVKSQNQNKVLDISVLVQYLTLKSTKCFNFSVQRYSTKFIYTNIFTFFMKLISV